MAKNLLDKLGLTDDIPESEVRFLMDKIYGAGGLITKNEIVYPSDTQYSIKVRFKAGKIVSVEQGPRPLPKKFDELCKQIQDELINTEQGFASDILFCQTNLIKGSFFDQQHGIQILPPPTDAPKPPQLHADNPFIIEFPIKISSDMQLTNARRMRSCREWALVLNILLSKPIKTTNPTHRQSWYVTHDDMKAIKWGMEFYFIKKFPRYMTEYSPMPQPEISRVSHQLYYSNKYFGPNSGELEIPDSLSDSLQCFSELSPDLKRIFLQAAFWISSAHNLWHENRSAYFAAMISAIETLMDKSSAKEQVCPECGSILGVTRAFRDFLTKYVPVTDKNLSGHNLLYEIRSNLVHGEYILDFDESPLDYGSPDFWNEFRAINDLADITRTAILNWLWAQSKQPLEFSS